MWPLCLASFTIFPFGRLKYFFYMRFLSCLINFFLTIGFKAPLLQDTLLSILHTSHIHQWPCPVEAPNTLWQN